MNFLAHLYLSGSDDEIMVGNILADRSKGLVKNNLSEGILNGIKLHYAIDHYTDNHPVVAITKKRLNTSFGHYAPVITDVFYDHFLAANWKDYSDVPLEVFAKKCYSVLRKHKNLFPVDFRFAFIYMRFRNLLVSYRTIDGIKFAFDRMVGRAVNSKNLHLAIEELKKNYPLYEEEFKEFFKDAIKRFQNGL
jgi:acyl carrier protein phosphodiesterase